MRERRLITDNDVPRVGVLLQVLLYFKLSGGPGSVRQKLINSDHRTVDMDRVKASFEIIKTQPQALGNTGPSVIQERNGQIDLCVLHFPR